MTRALDTSVVIDLLRGRDEALRQRFLAGSPVDYAVPEMTRAELLLGAALSRRPQENRLLLEQFLAPLRSLPFDARAAATWAEIRATLQNSGCTIGPNDLVIAATARAFGCTLLTRNAAEFQRVPGLAVEIW